MYNNTRVRNNITSVGTFGVGAGGGSDGGTKGVEGKRWGRSKFGAMRY